LTVVPIVIPVTEFELNPLGNIEFAVGVPNKELEARFVNTLKLKINAFLNNN